jgi:hypothetical protein
MLQVDTGKKAPGATTLLELRAENISTAGFPISCLTRQEARMYGESRKPKLNYCQDPYFPRTQTGRQRNADSLWIPWISLTVSQPGLALGTTATQLFLLAQVKPGMDPQAMESVHTTHLSLMLSCLVAGLDRAAPNGTDPISLKYLVCSLLIARTGFDLHRLWLAGSARSCLCLSYVVLSVCFVSPLAVSFAKTDASR